MTQSHLPQGLAFASLGSGSEGNALVISAADGMTRTHVMLDCGFTLRETEARLARIGLVPGDINAIVVTHEHKDHVGGVCRFARRHHTPVIMTRGTHAAVVKDTADVVVTFCRDGEPFDVGCLTLHPFTVPHDAREPVQFVMTCAGQRLGVLTDVGHPTPYLIEKLAACDGLVLECNHDVQMLRNSAYPPSVRQRIGGTYGHLSNDESTRILSAMDKTRLKMVIGAHLSKQNNLATLAHDAIVAGLGATQCEIVIADQEEGFGWIYLAAGQPVTVAAGAVT